VIYKRGPGTGVPGKIGANFFQVIVSDILALKRESCNNCYCLRFLEFSKGGGAYKNLIHICVVGPRSGRFAEVVLFILLNSIMDGNREDMIDSSFQLAHFFGENTNVQLDNELSYQKGVK